jgi:hypothetical protein
MSRCMIPRWILTVFANNSDMSQSQCVYVSESGTGSETDSSQNILFMDILVRLIRSDGVLKHALAVRDKEAPQSDKARGCRSGA